MARIYLFGRRITPMALSVSIACFSMAMAIWTGTSVWGDPTDAWSLAVAVCAMLSAGLLWVGWWGRHPGMTVHGLLIASGVFTARGVYIVLEGGNLWTAAISWAWVVGAGWSAIMNGSEWGDERRGGP